MKRLLIISALLISLINMVSQGAVSASFFHSSGGPNVIAHFHSDGDGLGYFHPHPVSVPESLWVDRQLLDCKTTKVVHYGRTGLETTCLHPTILPIPNQERGRSLIFWSYLTSRKDIWHLGISSGGVPS
jgi:hypothetical protein